MEQIVIKFHEGTRVRLRGGALVAQPRNPRENARLAALGLTGQQVATDVHAVHALLASSRHARGLERLFTASEEALAARRSEGEIRSGRELADLDLYYRVRVPSGVTQVEVEYLVSDLNALASVEVAYAQPPVAPPADIPPATPNFESNQGYLDPAPTGIDARYAWTVAGGRGQGVRIVDIEGGWRTTHEDLPALFYRGGTQINDLGWRNHGTAVLGEMVALANGYGVTGIAHQAQAGYESFSGQGTASAVINAAAAAGPGGLVLIELHAQGPATPGSPCNCSGSQCDYVPMEYWQDIFDAIAQVTANGTLVIEAGGNGATNLDDAVYQGRFNRSQRDSGAILVGASNSLDRAPTCFTNYGSRIDVHGWGWDVTTLGYGNLFNGGGDENQYYTNSFSGTSSASPIVTGAAAALQGVSLAAGRGNIGPFAMRQLLRDTGTPQAADARQIGPLPDLRAAITRLLAQLQPTIRFSQSTYSASETAADPRTEPVVIVNVTRTGNLSGTSTVEYQTIDDPAAVPCDPNAPGGPYPQGVAYARCDYATTIDTLTFAPGESQKSFRIPLVNDSHVEQPETFIIALSNPVGATLGSPVSASVTINSDDTGGGPNPINNHQFFVRQHYLDFLSREPDAGGFDAWLSVLNNCADPFNVDPNSPSAACDRITVSSSFFRSQEFEIKGLYVYKFYRVAFHNPPSSLPAYSDISRDMRSVTGQTAQEVYAKKAAYADAFVQRPAFRNIYDGLSNAAYVAALLNPYNLTAITTTDPANPDTGGQVTLTQADLTSRLDNFTLTRAQVLRAVVQSQEVNAAEFNGAFVAMQYYGYLRRTPEESGYNAWLAHLNANPSDFRTMVHGFLYSQEYMLRFGPLSSGSFSSMSQPVEQSSEEWGGVAARAIDGSCWSNSVTDTQIGTRHGGSPVWAPRVSSTPSTCGTGRTAARRGSPLTSTGR